MKKKDRNAKPDEPVTEQALPQDETQEAAPQDAPEAEQAREATVEEWQAALELAVKQRDELKDSLLRAQADFQNFKRRNQTARSDGYEDGVREAIAATLPAIDNLERAIDAAEKTDDDTARALAEGVKMTLNTLMEGLTFDPEKHNAVMREVTDDPGKVLEVFQKGYRVKDRIIRYAMVKVSVEG